MYVHIYNYSMDLDACQTLVKHLESDTCQMIEFVFVQLFEVGT